VILGLTVFGVAVCCLAAYRISLSLHPFTNCPRCNGNGKNAGSTRTKFGRCRKCGGSGRRERLGRRVFGIDRDR
jgi:DnaJ-class molecular chaperone